jgi:hypothetical protein
LKDTTMIKTLLSAAVVATTLAGATLASTDTAEARWGRGGAFAAGAAVGLLGGALLAGPSYGYVEPGYYYEPTCFWKKKRFFDGYGGYYVKRVRICR